MSGVEAGVEFGLMGSTSTNSMAAPAIPLSHQLTSASPFVDSGVDLNVMAQFGGCRASIDEDEVFNGELNKFFLYQRMLFHFPNYFASFA